MKVNPPEYINLQKDYKTSQHLVYSCQYHVVFCPKYRRKLLESPYDEWLKDIFRKTADRYEFKIAEMEVMPDYVHMIIECNPRFGITRCIKLLKGNSSNEMMKDPKMKSRTPCLWTRSAFISSIGSVSADIVKQYIENQKGK